MELIKGNFVRWYGVPRRVNNHEVFEIHAGRVPNAKPMPITSEFLEDRLGFIHHQGVWTHKTTGFSLQSVTDDNLKVKGFSYTKLPSLVFTEAHELQNFFHIVTKEKL